LVLNAVKLQKNKTSIGLSLLRRLRGPLVCFDQKCSKIPKEQNLYRDFAALG